MCCSVLATGDWVHHDAQPHPQTDRQTDTDRHTDTDRQTQTQTDTHTETDTQTHKHTLTDTSIKLHRSFFVARQQSSCVPCTRRQCELRPPPSKRLLESPSVVCVTCCTLSKQTLTRGTFVSAFPVTLFMLISFRVSLSLSLTLSLALLSPFSFLLSLFLFSPYSVNHLFSGACDVW